MKHIFLGLFTLTSIMSMAQAKLGMSSSYTVSPGDTVTANTTVTLTTVVKNKGNANFIGSYTLNVALNNTNTVVPLASNTSSAGIIAGDSITEITTFTAQTGTNGWKLAGNGNTIVIWPISNGTETLDSLKMILTVNEPVGILDVEKEIFNIYPNPTKELLFIKPTSAIRFNEYIIYDIDAKEIEKGSYNEIILVSNLPKGIYWIVLQNGDKRYKQKFVKD